MFCMDRRPDDCFLKTKYQEEFDAEPPAAVIDYHAPSKNNVIKMQEPDTISDLVMDPRKTQMMHRYQTRDDIVNTPTINE